MNQYIQSVVKLLDQKVSIWTS